MKIRDLYKAILEAVGAFTDDDGLVSLTRPGADPIPFMVDKKRLAMPTAALLNKGAFNEGGSLIAFHPICENVVLETSPVLAKLETAMIFRLHTVLADLICQLATIAADHKQHKKMKVKTHGLLSAMPDADDRTRNDFIKIIEHTTAVGAKQLLKLYVRKGGTYGGEKVSRLARFFPSVVDHLNQEERKILGVSLRKADVPAFLALIEYILPDYRDADRYASPSNGLVAPTLHALLKTYYKVANQLNKIVDIHAAQLTNADALKIPVDWIDDVQDLSQYREQIPVLPGNDGEEGTKTVRQPTATAPVAKAVSTAFGAVVGNPHQITKPQAGKGGVSVEDALRATTPVRPGFQQQQPAFGVQGHRRGWAQQPDPQQDLPGWARSAPAAFGNNQPVRSFGGGGGGRL